MRNFIILLLLILFSTAAFAQKQKPVKKIANPVNALTPAQPAVGNEKDEFEKAVNQTTATEKIAALQKFIADFPDSADKTAALETIVAARAQIADEKLGAGDAAGGVENFTLAVKDAPKPVSDKLFTDILLQIPSNLYFRGLREAAIDSAKLIEEKVDGNAKQLLGLATFYLGVENADEAKRLAEKAVVLAPTLPAAYQTLGLANRLNFDLAESANAYSKALELDANSTVSRRSLAEMKRALGKSDEAVELYREISAKDEKDTTAKNGLILSLFDAGKQSEAEAEMAKSLAQNPNNLLLLTGAAYWYAANNNSAKSIELAQKAVNIEPRYIWSYMALARAFLRENRFLDAERALISARNYGNFPTLDYELATVRYAAGFYREAARELAKSFVVKDDSVSTRLGGRVEKQAKTFIELIAPERRASIFEPLAADNIENAQKLKNLLDFYQKLETTDATDAEIFEAADKFVGTNDKMQVHRQLFVANRLLEKKKLLPKISELMKAAVGGVDNGLSVPNAASAVLADELFESRSIAIAKNELVVVPEVPRQTLSNILRGRIEETVGWAFYQENKTPDAVVHLKRAVSVLPEKSAWWRSSMWRLGAALQADEKPKEALDAYIKGYTNDASGVAKRIIIETLYSQINGSLDGLDAKIGEKPISDNAVLMQKQEKTEDAPTTEKQISSVEPVPTPQAEQTPEPQPENKSVPQVQTEIQQKPIPTPEIKSNTETAPKSEPTPEIKETKPEPTPETSPAPETKSETKIEPKQTETAKTSNPENNTETAQKSLFEPVIITVPKSVILTRPKSEDSGAPEKSITATGDSGIKRQRIVDAPKSELPETRKCEISVSQESVSILNNGGNLGVLVGFETDGDDFKEITALSSSPKDVEVVLEPEIGALSRRVFFIVKSVSQKTGIFTVTFESPCGKREILVKVR